MTTINLYQNQQDQGQGIERNFSMSSGNKGFIFSLGIIIITVLVLLGLKTVTFVIAQNNKSLLNQIDTENKSLSGINNLERILDLQTRLGHIKDNLNVKNGEVSRIAETKVIQNVTADLNKNVILSEYKFEEGKAKATFEANNFNDVAQQIMNFKSKSSNFTGANVTDIKRGEKAIDCTVEMVPNQNE